MTGGIARPLGWSFLIGALLLAWPWWLAWLAASILYAFQIHQDAGNTSVLPGPLAYQAGTTVSRPC